jgi:NitT/TauT family transport system substrate-binding protein
MMKPALKPVDLLIAAGFCAFMLTTPARADTTVTLASAQQSVGTLPVVVAEQRGLFKAEGLKIEIVDFNGGGAAVQALAGGSTDLCLCAADHPVRLYNRGLGGAVVVALYDMHPYTLLSKSSSPWTDLKSMKGQRIGITSAGSLTDNTLRYEIKQLGLDPDSDYQIIGVGLGGPMRAAVDAGAIAAGFFSTPDTQIELGIPGAYKITEDFRKIEYPSLDLVAVASWLKTHDATAKAVARAVVKAEQLIQTDPTAIRAAIKEMFPQMQPAIAESVAQDVTAHGLSRDGKVSEVGYATMMTMLTMADPTVKPVPYKDVVLTKYLPGPGL